ncbi:DUF4255 domain-containing protein [Acidothermaceae bacterium B102]|nr:DUF4255 domain-containing protein [Acidothermaceae bacterium B102]
MLNLIDESLEALLRTRVPLSARDVDIAFEAPDRDWAARITRPTVNLFLWDLRRNLEEQDAGVEKIPGPGGRLIRRAPLPRLDCRYLVTAWTSDVRDEHSLLGSVLRACLLAPELDPELLPRSYARVRPLPCLNVAMPDGKEAADFWSAVGGQLKPGLDVVVTATMDASVDWTAGPDVQSYELWLRNRNRLEEDDHLTWSRSELAEPARPAPAAQQPTGVTPRR